MYFQDATLNELLSVAGENQSNLRQKGIHPSRKRKEGNVVYGVLVINCASNLGIFDKNFFGDVI
jgi:hypothetical protein